MRRILLALVLATTLMTSAAAEPFDDAVDAYTRGEYAAAVRLYRPLAEQGNAEAQWRLGFMYEQGKGVPQDYSEAAKWYRLAAEQGNAPAQLGLGTLYYNGRGVPQDDAEAVKWYRLAAEQGDAEAHNNLGVMYANGKGVPQDIVQAYKWFSIGASKSAASDQPKDRIEAAQNRDLAASQMTPEQIADGQKLAGEWKPK